MQRRFARWPVDVLLTDRPDKLRLALDAPLAEAEDVALSARLSDHLRRHELRFDSHTTYFAEDKH